MHVGDFPEEENDKSISETEDSLNENRCTRLTRSKTSVFGKTKLNFY